MAKDILLQEPSCLEAATAEGEEDWHQRFARAHSQIVHTGTVVSLLLSQLKNIHDLALVMPVFWYI